jgi:hypothetical protein
MNPRSRLKAAAFVVGLILYGPLIVALSIWGLDWSVNQEKSPLVLVAVALSLLFLVIGFIVIGLTVWLGYEFYVERRRSKLAGDGQLPDSVDIAPNASA